MILLYTTHLTKCQHMVPEEHVWKLPYLLLFFPRHLEDSFPVLLTFIFLYLDDIFCVSDVERTHKVSSHVC